jgi:GMP synthase PP-ATPase subunit
MKSASPDYDEVWQACAALLPMRAVGLTDDDQTHERVCITCTAGTTDDSHPFDHAFFARTSGRIIKEVKVISQVVYDATSKLPRTIEWN